MSARMHRGITLVELLVVIGICGILLGLLIPAVQRVRDSSFRMRCSNNLKQIGLALCQYHDAYQRLPPGCSYENGGDPYPYMSWCARILPFVDQTPLWTETTEAYAQEPHFGVVPPHLGFSTVIPVFACPADDRTAHPWPLQNLSGVSASSPLNAAFTSYLGVEGTNQTSHDGLLYLDSRVRLVDISDGASNTLIVGEHPRARMANWAGGTQVWGNREMVRGTWSSGSRS